MHRTDIAPAFATCCTGALLVAPVAVASDIEAPHRVPAGLASDTEALRSIEAPVDLSLNRDGGLDSTSLEWCAFTFDPSLIDAGALGGDRVTVTADAPASAATAAPRFGSAGSWRWQIVGGGGTGTDSISNAQLGAGVSWFVVDDLSIDVQVNADYFNQSGPSAWGGDVELLFRWHFLARDTWSLYVDGGCGLMWTSRDVPPDSASFNFLPQAGAGVTWEIAADTRLMIGARWFHASNANTGSPNPSYNGVFAYAGVSFGF